MRLHTSASSRDESSRTFSGDLAVVAYGAINSATLLLRWANDAYLNRLANSSDQVGRNFMKHFSTVIVS